MAVKERTTSQQADTLRADANWQRYQYGRLRGHISFILQAKRCEGFYFGAGRQWTKSDTDALATTGRKPVEQNEIFQMVNTAIGYQIANRMDITLQPRGHGADEESATTMTKVIKQVADNNQLHWRETDLFGDGMIMGRGYYDIRMSFLDNAQGEINISTLDPLDVIPDPDANTYDPAGWADVTVTRWYTLDEIEQHFGKAKRRLVQMLAMASDTASTSLDESSEEQRTRFGQEGVPVGNYADSIHLSIDATRYRIIDRQYRTFEKTLCAVYPNGDIRPIPTADKEQRNAYLQQGCLLVQRMMPRVKWLVSTSNVVLFDDYSPYPWFTIVPYFPYFRRGTTIGMIDNQISPQEVLNKSLSQWLHILNTVANSGWIVEQDSVTNMSEAEFKDQSAKNGLVIYYKQGSKPPEKIQSSGVPTGVAEIITQVYGALKSVSGVSDVVSGDMPANEMSGVAYQARQYAAQQKLAIPLDALARTRYLLASRMIDLIQMFYDAPRIMRITEKDLMGNDVSVDLAVNQPVEGSDHYLRDLTLGEYDIVISEQPMQVTFDNSQFEQIKSMVVDMKLPIPPQYVIRYSTLADKDEIAKSIEQNQKQSDPLTDAKAALLAAQEALARAKTENARIEAIYGATQAGAQIAAMPQVATIADEVLQSAGFSDQNAAPIIPQQSGAGLAAAAPAAPTVAVKPPMNTDPTKPANPGIGLEKGIEAPGVQATEGAV